VGLQLAELPLDVATVAAMLCVQGVWFAGGGDRRALEAAKARCATSHSARVRGGDLQEQTKALQVCMSV